MYRIIRKFGIWFELDINENGTHKNFGSVSRIVNRGKFTINTTFNVYIIKKKCLN